jgi:hypothetical protein
MIGTLNTPTLPKKRGARPFIKRKCAKFKTSKYERWLLATITAPDLGIFSAPIQVRLVIKLMIGIMMLAQILNVLFVPSG